MPQAEGEFDVVALGGALLADPEWVRKLHEGRSDEHVAYRQEQQQKRT